MTRTNRVQDDPLVRRVDDHHRRNQAEDILRRQLTPRSGQEPNLHRAFCREVRQPTEPHVAEPTPISQIGGSTPPTGGGGSEWEVSGTIEVRGSFACVRRRRRITVYGEAQALYKWMIKKGKMDPNGY